MHMQMLEWHGNAQSSVRWPEYDDWLTERIIRLREVMGKRV